MSTITVTEATLRTFREPTTLPGRLALLNLALWSHNSPLFLPTLGSGSDADREYYITRRKQYFDLFSKEQRDWAKREWCRARRWWVEAKYEADGKTLRQEGRKEEEQEHEVRRDSACAALGKRDGDEEDGTTAAMVDYDSE
jgi:hypothetical protein